MMPSRGWQMARGSGPRLYQAQCRNLSNTRQIPRAGLTIRRTSQWRPVPSTAIRSLPSIRYASTSPTSTPSESTTQPPPSVPVESTSLANLDTITLDDIDLSTTADAANIPEKIGYLQEIGLNYGWGPTSMIEWAIEHIHIYTGLPWWCAVALTALGIRAAMMPLYIKSSDMMARSMAIASVTKPITDRMTEARKTQDTAAIQGAYAELLTVRRRAGISMLTQVTPMITQGIIGFCGFRLIRAMAALPVPALKTDGFLWLQDMTLADPFLILPIAMAGTMHLLVRMGGESGGATTDQMAPGTKSFMMWGMPAVILMATGFQSGLVCVWFITGGALGVAQSLALRNEKVRSALGITPMYKPKPGEQSPTAGLGGLFGGGASANSGGPTAQAKTASHMYGSYQSPNVRRNPGRVIDVNAVDKKSSSTNTGNAKVAFAHAPAEDVGKGQTGKKPGIFDRASTSFKDMRSRFQNQITEEQMEQRRKDAFKKRAQEYERRYQERTGR